jgi:hypothetical protein
MTPDGRFRTQPARGPWGPRILVTAVLVAAVAGTLAVAALALWFALALIPIAIIAGLVAAATYRVQAWRARRSRSIQPFSR